MTTRAANGATMKTENFPSQEKTKEKKREKMDQGYLRCPSSINMKLRPMIFEWAK